MKLPLWTGTPYPLGATFDGNGVNFAVLSEKATAIEVCIFDVASPGQECASFRLIAKTNHIFHGYVPKLQPGSLYGIRASGPWAPKEGLRFNPHKLLIDPYAKAFFGKPDWTYPLLGQRLEGEVEMMDARNSAAGVPKGIVLGDDFDWGADLRPETPWSQTVIYELHLKGFTQLHPHIPAPLRGTYLGLAHPAAIQHLQQLGVTTVKLLPVHECASEAFLHTKQLTNYWGYNTLGFFAPEQRYASSKTPGAAVHEFKEMVRTLHAAGIEVLIDVVYNHSCEGNHLGPTLSFKGLDNTTYYWLNKDNLARYRDFTGCGNSLSASNPHVVKLIMDSLRYWVNEMRVDGFRFDLATTLARSAHGRWNPRADFFIAIQQDPVLSRVKLIAEPWDVGNDGYKLGNFPLDFAEWNDKYRDTLRRFWRGDAGQLTDLGYRLSGSSDFFKASARQPSASINYVCSHDGFTLRDLVSYSSKQNEANGEENRDGADENHSCNWGVEGETSDAEVLQVRDSMQRNFLASLFLSIGTPMLQAGDELGRTQKGNNNAYCQDNELTWLNWALNEAQQKLLEFTRACIALRRAQPVLQRQKFFGGNPSEDLRFRDLVWFHPSGRELSHADWENPELRCFGMLFGSKAITTLDHQGRKKEGDSLLTYFNAAPTQIEVILPPHDRKLSWKILFETIPSLLQDERCKAGMPIALQARSVMVLRLHHD